MQLRPHLRFHRVDRKRPRTHQDLLQPDLSSHTDRLHMHESANLSGQPLPTRLLALYASFDVTMTPAARTSCASSTSALPSLWSALALPISLQYCRSRARDAEARTECQRCSLFLELPRPRSIFSFVQKSRPNKSVVISL